MANPFDIANFNLVNFANILPDVLDSDPKTVEYTYKDASGNILTKNVENRGLFKQHLWDDVGGALGQFNRTFYVDAINGDDNNDGSSLAPFKTVLKALYATPQGGRSVIFLQRGQTHYIGATASYYMYNKHITIDDYGDTSLDYPILKIKSWVSGDYNYFALFQGGNYSIHFRNITFQTQLADDSLEVNSGWGIFGRSILGTIEVSFYYCNINLPHCKLISDTNDLLLIKLHLKGCNITIDFLPMVSIAQGANLIYTSYANSFTDSSDNAIAQSDLFAGIIRDADSGNPINLLSNINFSS